MIQEGLQVFLHLDRVVLDLSHGEDPESALAPGAVLFEEEGKEHE